MLDYQIGFIGTGQMATALATGFHQAAEVPLQNLHGFDISIAALSRFTETLGGGHAAGSYAEVIRDCDLVFLAVKPQVIREIVHELRPRDPSVVYVSVMGGITLEWLQEHLQTDQVIRTMPNTPCLIGQGAVAIAPSEAVEDELVDDIVRLFQSVGLAVTLPERLIDAVTGLSGSGPAFVFQFIEALSDGAVHQGLPRDVALKLAAQTVAGAASMVLASGEHPAVLKDRVASPAGTTIAGLKALEENGLRAATIQAVVAAAQRSAELGQR